MTRASREYHTAAKVKVAASGVAMEAVECGCEPATLTVISLTTTKPGRGLCTVADVRLIVHWQYGCANYRSLEVGERNLKMNT